MSLVIKNLSVSVNGKLILQGLSLEVKPGEIHVLMGPNGSGKSTLAQVIAGHPSYKVNGGSLMVNGEDIAKLTPDKRAKLGIFLGFQHPVEVPGVSVFNFLRRAKQSIESRPKAQSRIAPASPAKRGEPGRVKAQSGIETSGLPQFREELLEYASSLRLSDDILRRSLNEGFSGGEKKRNEIMQMMALKPKLAILDEIDSGLDVDGLKNVALAIKKFALVNSRSSLVLITHYARILKYLKPDFVHVMVEGKIVKSGTSRLATEIERSGYENFKSRVKNSKFKMQNYNAKFKSL